MSIEKSSSSKQLLWVIVILSAFIIVSIILFSIKPEVKRRGNAKPQNIVVEVQTLRAEAFQIKIPSYGIVEPRTQTILFSQVSGQIIEVTNAFREGEFFEKGDVLLQIDDRDYRTQLTISEADLQFAIQNLEEEKARVEQAVGDWKRSGKTTPAPVLALRKPQMAAAAAQLRAAESKKGQAERNLNRTQIVAPYAGRVLNKQVDVGQLISPSAALGEIYAVDYVEIRLPLKNKALSFIELPESFRHSGTSGENPTVIFNSDLGDANQQWQGKIVRTEGAIDSNTNQLYVIAQIDDPYSLSQQAIDNQAVPLKIGQYLEASIAGRKLNEVIVIPAKTLYQGNYVFLYKDGVVERQPVKIAWRDLQQIVIADGLKSGDQLVITTLGQITTGTAVVIKNGKPEARGNRQGGNKK